MTASKIIKIAVTAVLIAAAAFFGYRWWTKKGPAATKGTVYVMSVRDSNSAGGMSLSGSKFPGVIEAQKTEDIKYDTNKKIKAFKVKEGDYVKEGDVLFTYDVESQKLENEKAELDLERAKYELETKKTELAGLEAEKLKASASDQTRLATEILSMQSDIATSEYEIKASENELEKNKKSVKDSKVKATIDGIIKSVSDLSSYEMADENIVVTISRGDDYRIKGLVNEQMINELYNDMPVIIRSRVDDTQIWHGTVSSIERNNPQKSNDEYSMYSDNEQSSSKYAFYVEPENFDGLMLGQHIIIEPDFGMDLSDDSKSGIWLFSDFIFEENGKSYVWAESARGKLEKREVEIGKRDDDYGDCEIVSGLELDDNIAYPSEQFVEGMNVTENYEEADVPENEDEQGGEYDFLEGEGGDLNMDDLPNAFEDDLTGDEDGEDLELGDFDFG